MMLSVHLLNVVLWGFKKYEFPEESNLWSRQASLALFKAYILNPFSCLLMRYFKLLDYEWSLLASSTKFGLLAYLLF